MSRKKHGFLLNSLAKNKQKNRSLSESFKYLEIPRNKKNKN